MFWGRRRGGVRFQSWACNLGFGVQEFRVLGLEEFRDPQTQEALVCRIFRTEVYAFRV